MKVISMSALEVLPALLRFFESGGKEGKFTTWRPAWTKCTHGCVGFPIHYQEFPRFDIGELAQIQWRQRTSPKGSWFCKKCGEMDECEHLSQIEGDPQSFPKVLGVVKMVGIERNQMVENEHNSLSISHAAGTPCRDDGFDFYAKPDGFSTWTEFVGYFKSNYDLSTPRPFWRYEWRLP